jgi:hypothetical protein
MDSFDAIHGSTARIDCKGSGYLFIVTNAAEDLTVIYTQG